MIEGIFQSNHFVATKQNSPFTEGVLQFVMDKETPEPFAHP